MLEGAGRLRRACAPAALMLKQDEGSHHQEARVKVAHRYVQGSQVIQRVPRSFVA